MYDDLIATLRDMSKMGMKYGMAVVTMREAADAIEKLEQENSFLKEMQRQLVKDVPIEDLGRMVYAGIRRGGHV